MNYQGDVALGDTLDVKFTTVATTGVPTTLAGTPAVAAYVDNSTTEITAGITLTVDFDARAGLHNIRVVATSGNGFATATNVNLVITAGTVSGNSVVGYVVGSFSIGKRPVNVTLWAGSATATGNIAIKNTLANGTDITGTPADSAGVTTLLGRVTSTLFTGITSLKEWLGLMAGKQSGNATARTEIRSTGAGSGTFDETTDSNEAMRDRGDAAWITGAGGDPWATALPGAYGAGTAGNIIGNNLNAAVTTRATPAQVQTELGTYGALKPTVAARTLDVNATGECGIDWANIGAPTTVQALSGTTIATVTTLTNDPPGVTTLLARITSTLFTGITSLSQWLGMITGKQVGNATARTEMRATGAGSGTFDETTDSQEAIRDRGDVSWITGAGGDPWLTALPGAYGAGTAGNIIGGNLNATVSSRATPAQVQTELGTYGALKPTVAARTLDVSIGGEAGVDWANVGSPTTANALSATTISTSQTVGSVTSPVTLTAAYDAAKTASTQASQDVIGTYVDTEVGAIKAKTDQLTFTAGRVDANATTAIVAGDLTAIADAILKRDWTALSGEAAYSLLNAARMLRNSWNTTSGTLTIKKEDGVTNAWTRTLSVDPTAQPITGAT